MDKCIAIIPARGGSKRIPRKNIKDFVPRETHFYANNKIMLSAYSLKWIYKKIKRDSNFTLEDLNG